MKSFFTLISIFSFLFLVGCGHNMYHKVEGTGAYGRIPTPDGGSLIEVAIGDMNITSGVLRGGATLDENTSKGGTFGSVSLGRHTHFSTAPSINEGNIEKVLTSPHTDEKTKQLVALYLITRKHATPPTANVTSVNAASATGDGKSIPMVSPTKTGIDNAVDKVAETAPKVVKPIVKGTENVAKHVTTTVGTTSEHISDSFLNKATYIIIGGIILLIIIALIVLIIVKRYKKSKIEAIVDTVQSVENIITETGSEKTE
jgi:hypothetical protein